MRWLKLILGILLLPACAALTIAAWSTARECLFATRGGALPAWAFGAGYVLWLAVFALLPRPTRTYILGHELTHALWALLMGARVSRLRVSKTGGQVQTSKTNWVIALSPYFFPFYALLFIGLFFLGHAIWGLERYTAVLFFLVGLGWSFHVTFTLTTLFTVAQPDLKSQGFIFSAVVIYAMNLVVILLCLAGLARAVTLGGIVRHLGADLGVAYGWVIEQAGRLARRWG